MPPKGRSSKASQNGAVQPADALSIAMKPLQKQLKTGAKTKTIIESTKAVLDKVDAALKSLKTRHEEVDSSLVLNLVSEFDTEDNSMCSRFSPQVYDVLLRTILQAEYSREGERGLYLLAAASYHDESLPKEAAAMRKKSIGLRCLHNLLDYLVNEKNHRSMKRWAGAFCLQLVQECNIDDPICGSVENYPEGKRRKLGHLIFYEESEIVRMIAGQFVGELVEAGMDREQFWPLGTDKNLYDGLPSPHVKWTDKFNTYIDNIWQSLEPEPEMSEQLYFTQNVTIVPQNKFDAAGTHNVYATIGNAYMTVWTGSRSNGKFNQCLEVPHKLIERLNLTATSSQLPKGVVYVEIFIAEDEASPCYVDCQATAIRMIAMQMSKNTLGLIQETLSNFRPALEVYELGSQVERYEFASSEGQQSPGKPRTQSTSSQQSVRSGVSETIVAGGVRISTSMYEDDKAQHDDCQGNRQEDCNDPPEDEQESDGLEKIHKLHIPTPPKAASNPDPPKAKASVEAPEKHVDEVEETQEQPILSQTTSKPVSIKSKANPLAEACGTKADEREETQQQTVHSKVNSKVELKSQKQSAALRPKAKKPLIQPKPRLSPSRKTSAKQSTVTLQRSAPASDLVHIAPNGQKAQSSLQEMDNKVQNLSKVLPTTDIPQLRAALLVSHGDEKGAIECLTKSSRKPAGPDKASLAVSFDSGSITSPDVHDASTPKVVDKAPNTNSVAAVKKDWSQKSVKDSTAAKPDKKVAKHSLPVSAAQSFPLTKKANAILPEKSKGKSKSFSKGTDPDEFDLVLSDEEIVPVTKSKKVAKSDRKESDSSFKIGKSKKADAGSKRQSAPAALGRSRRSAAIKASQSMVAAGLSDDEFEEPDEVVVAVSTKHKLKAVPKDKKYSLPGLKVAQKKVEDKLAASPAEEDPDEIQQDVNYGEFTDTQQEDLYDATPKKVQQSVPLVITGTAAQPRIHAVSKKEIPATAAAVEKPAKPPGDFASNLGDLLGNYIDDDDAQPASAPAPTKIAVIEPPCEVVTGDGQLLVIANECSHVSRIDTFEEAEANAEDTIEDAIAGDLQPPQVDEDTVHCPADSNTSGSSSGTKRKASKDRDDLAKRKRIDKDTKDPGETQAPSRRSPRLEPESQQRMSEVLVEKPEFEKMSIPVVPTWSSPPLAGKNTDPPLVDDHLARKLPLIAFSKEGPRNQGLSSSIKRKAKEPSPKESVTKVPFEPSSPPRDNAKGKRKRPVEDANLVPGGSHGMKRRSMSPREDDIPDMGEAPDLNSSPPRLSPQPSQISVAKSRQSQRSRASKGFRHTSQLSRVDANGSPIASKSSQIDHMQKAAKKLRDDPPPPSPLTKTAAPVVMDRSQSPSIFGPKVILGGRITKAKPALPEEVVIKYVPHTLDGNGVYEDVGTKQVIALEKSTSDPFSSPAAKSVVSAFSDRLQPKPKAKGKPNQKKLVEEIQQIFGGDEIPTSSPVVKPNSKPLNEFSNKPARKTTSKKVASQSQEAALFASAENTLIGSENLPPSDDISSQIIAGPSQEAYSSDDPSSSPSQNLEPAIRWNMAIRPHYTKLSDAVHRIADEVVVRMAKEEDALALLVKRYQQEGSKLLQDHLQQRAADRDQLRQDMSQKKAQLATIYKDTAEFVGDTKQEAAKNSIADYEKKWKKNSEKIRDMIDKTKRGSG